MEKIIWALFGNDDDGPYGFYPHTTWGAIRWWLRNPFHNFTHYVINWPGGPHIEIKGTGFYIGWRLDGRFGIKLQFWNKD